ncbi:MAG: flagellar FlbD family protein [Sphingomonadaceae bacterium]
MIRVTRLDGSVLTINCDLVESVEGTPDTVVSLWNGHKLVVRETAEEIVERVVEYRRRLHLCPLLRNRLDAPAADNDVCRNPVS